MTVPSRSAAPPLTCTGEGGVGGGVKRELEKEREEGGRES